ncbi:MAG: hypothetical protein KatS3mg035_0992 [Bacteroidia bacterium]|nr:MAG: hypothetical protein KatS3mg035_0992 [Bacteroidia bacterium]
MGYTTDFLGSFKLNKPLSPKMKEFLTKFAETRRMARKQPEMYGVEGEFYVDSHSDGQMGQSRTSDIIDYNNPPITQPGLWCQWVPNENGTAIEWDCGEKFYYYTEWLMYLIHKILAPNGYVLNGQVTWQGEETGDVGEIYVENNKVFTEPYHGKKKEFNLTDCRVYHYGKGEILIPMRTDIVLDEETMRAVNIADMKKVVEVAVEKKAPAKTATAKKTPKRKSVTIKIEGLKDDLNEKQMKALMQVVRQYTEGLVDKKESEYTLKHKKTELKAR